MFLYLLFCNRFGRRIPLLFAVVIQLISGLAASFTPWFWLFCLLRFVIGIGVGGTMPTSTGLILEITGVKWREFVIIIGQTVSVIGHILLPTFSYYFRDWRTFQLVISLPTIILLSYYWLLPESPRWLFATGSIDQATQVLKQAAKINGKPTHTIKQTLLHHQMMEQTKDTLKNGSHSTGKTVTALDLFRTPNMRIKTICMMMNWFALGMVYMGVAQYIGQTGGNIFVNVVTSGCLAMIGSLFCLYAMKQFGRRKFLCATNTMSALTMFAIAFIPAENVSTIVGLSSIGMCTLSVSFAIANLYAGEVFPTVLRSTGVGVVTTCGGIGSMIAPFVTGLSTIVYWLPPVIFGAFSILAAVLVLPLPETRGALLPETLEDGEKFGKKMSNDCTAEAIPHKVPIV